MESDQTRNRGGMVNFVAALAVASAVLLSPQGPMALAQPQRASANQEHEQTMAEQIAELRASLARLEAQLERIRQAGGVDMSGGGMGGGGMGANAMGGSGGAGMGARGMGGGGMGGGGMGANAMGGSGGAGMGARGMGGGGMGANAMGGSGSAGMGARGMGGGGMGAGGMSSSGVMGSAPGSVSQQSSLPGFSGVSHLYHIGADNFFLDHDDHITLTVEQRAGLGRIQENAVLQSATFDRRIAELEQEMWVLTASDQPDIRQIEEKIRQIEQLRGDQRIAQVRAVGAAAQLLSANQRQALIGAESQSSGD